MQQHFEQHDTVDYSAINSTPSTTTTTTTTNSAKYAGVKLHRSHYFISNFKSPLRKRCLFYIRIIIKLLKRKCANDKTWWGRCRNTLRVRKMHNIYSRKGVHTIKKGILLNEIFLVECWIQTFFLMAMACADDYPLKGLPVVRDITRHWDDTLDAIGESQEKRKKRATTTGHHHHGRHYVIVMMVIMIMMIWCTTKTGNRVVFASSPHQIVYMRL